MKFACFTLKRVLSWNWRVGTIVTLYTLKPQLIIISQAAFLWWTVCRIAPLKDKYILGSFVSRSTLMFHTKTLLLCTNVTLFKTDKNVSHSRTRTNTSTTVCMAVMYLVWLQVGILIQVFPNFRNGTYKRVETSPGLNFKLIKIWCKLFKST